MSAKKNIFAIYASQDKDVLLYLLLHLQPLEKDYNIAVWQDNPIYPGQPWKLKDTSRLDRADIFLLLVSDAFMHSEFIQQDEFKMVIDRYKAGKATVIPILVDDCPWDIDFNSDDYNFNFKELQVFPEDRKPIGDWNTTDQVFQQVSDHIKELLRSSTKNRKQEEPKKNRNKKAAKAKREEQIALNFFDEQEEKNRIEKKNKLKEEAETIKKTEEEKKQKEDVEAKGIALEEQRLNEDAETKKRIEEEKKQAFEAEARSKAEQEAKRNEKPHTDHEEEQENSRAEEEYQPVVPNEISGSEEETQTVENKSSKKKVLVGFSIAALVAVGIWIFSVFNTDPEKKVRSSPNRNTTEVDVETVADTRKDSGSQETSFSKLNVGDAYEGGLIFSIDESSKTAKIAYTEDVGPIPWQTAIKIHEQLGEEWRLPTLDELVMMYRTIGQGASNEGRFADELYWSATAYDQNQARLLRFSDGNTSYHYNKNVDQRKFYVRAIRDFEYRSKE